ncbi:MAG TPA: hypothetical protein VK154_04620 [Chitinophagales bacterium]|nr:hypothetical protein [Chitinophagales bacterium]
MKNVLLFLFIAFAFSSCKNLVPYTDSMKKKYNWGESEIKRIQFYVSHDIVLHREAQKGSTDIEKGVIKNVRGRKVDEIIIPAGTKGIVTEIPKESKLLVSFETGDDRYLSFGVNPNASDRYVLLASDWKNEMGKVHYAGDEYYTDPDSKYASLLVDLRKIEKMEVKQRIAKGRKIQ